MGYRATFKRHDLLYLDGFELPDHQDRSVIAKWLEAGRPAIVRRPGIAFGGKGVHCGIPLPPEHGKRRMAFIAPVNSIKYRGGLPELEICLIHLSNPRQAQLAEFLDLCRKNDFRPEVFGSLAWRHLTGLNYLHEDSDVDLRFRVNSSMELERLVSVLRSLPQHCSNMCDIEVELWNDMAFSWREFRNDSSQLMVKTLSDVLLVKKSLLSSGRAGHIPDWAELIAFEAVSALREELESYPKPGLVSHVDNGSHEDMNAGHFKASIAVLGDYFRDIAGAGMRAAGMAELRQLGIAAEKEMFSATGGVNTHRGAIFTLGLLAAAAGYKLTSRSPEDLGGIVVRLWGKAIKGDEVNEQSHGSEVARRYGCGGAKDEAAGGFQSVYKLGLPAFKSVRETHCRNAARTHAVFGMLEKIQDTTLLYRGGLDGLEYARSAAGEFNRRGGVNSPDWENLALDVHREFMRRNFSCGGVADLLAATLFIQRMEELCPV
ncbi:MAG: malonate decarboxylase holo-[acyl-carrier-protein] synthase [Victivallales bacterium]|jgi:triphosphoribosyl-dephospho-CoA synthase